MLLIVNTHLPLSEEEFVAQDDNVTIKRDGELFTIVCDRKTGTVNDIRLQECYLTQEAIPAFVSTTTTSGSNSQDASETVDAQGGICIPS
jgi:hypothetical protein